MKSWCIFLCGEATEKVHLCTFLPSACQVVRGYSGRVFRETPCFCFSLQEREGGGKQGARWLPIGSSYPLDDVYGALPSAAEHTALKEAFFQLKRKSSTRSDPAPVQPLPPPPARLQNPSSFLPCFPWLRSKCFMWLDWGRLEVDPCPCP